MHDTDDDLIIPIEDDQPGDMDGEHPDGDLTPDPGEDDPILDQPAEEVQ